MAVTPKLKFYLSQGDLALVIPELYAQYKGDPFTVTDAVDKVNGFRKVTIMQLHILGIVEKIKVPAFLNARPRKWKITPEACVGIKRYLDGEKSVHKRRSVCKTQENK